MTVHALLSGGIGSGKSTASGVLTALGATVISADEAAHRVLEPGGAAEDAVMNRWPEVIAAGRIDRRLLGRVVFSESGLIAELEAMTHPAIRALLQEQVDEAEPALLIVVEMPLLVDFLGEGWVRIVVDAPEPIRIERLVDRGMTPDEISGRMAAQPGRDAWLEAADHVIDNGGDLVQLESECRRLWAELLLPEPPAGF